MYNMLLICNCLKTACVRAMCVGMTEKHHCRLRDKPEPCVAPTSRNSIAEEEE